MGQVTLRDIAQRCGVSRAAVSRILAGHRDRFSELTRQRVQAAAASMGYTPNLVGQALTRRRTMTVGILGHSFTGHVTAARLQALREAAQHRGYDTYLRETGRGVRDTDRLIEEAQHLMARRVDGLVVWRSAPITAKAHRFLKTLAVPTVFIDRGPPRHRARIILRRQPAFNALARHLAKLGHRRAMLFASIASADFPESRSYAYRRAFARAGLDLAVTYEQPPPSDDPRDAYRATHAGRRGYETVRRYLADPRAPAVSALCMNNDDAAIGALAALREAGVRVPEQMSVVGVDDLEASMFCEPPLTTIHAPRNDVGRAAFDMLERLIRQPEAEVEPIAFTYQLVPRQSTCAAPEPRRQAALSEEAMPE